MDYSDNIYVVMIKNHLLKSPTLLNYIFGDNLSYKNLLIKLLEVVKEKGLFCLFEF